ncbi:MAG TPA: hypothetical protein VKG82_00305 [Solirubrobacteraceae bacterium]|nr:hypothetical protein [Solirubrobacteraceae bacterium]HME04021.1 hypothetical protein [Solirubrobacteraceae bacterium]
MAPQDLVREHGQSVARVQREADAELRWQRRPAAPALAAVDDVIVDEERVVEQLDCDGDRQDLGVAAAESAACSHAECGPKRLSRPTRIYPRDAV